MHKSNLNLVIIPELCLKIDKLKMFGFGIIP
jgi:hypothetical protein